MQYTFILAPVGGVEPCESVQIETDMGPEKVTLRMVVAQLDDVEADDFDTEDLDSPLMTNAAYDTVCYINGFVEVNFP